jgi:hypothetical protein
VAQGWRTLHNEDLQYFSDFPNIIRVIKSRRVRWTGHVALMVEFVIHMKNPKDETTYKT